VLPDVTLLQPRPPVDADPVVLHLI
jgi:hypothetical protein